MNKKNYPGVSDRVKAVVIDTVVLVIFMIAATYVFSLFENVHDNARIAVFLFIFVLYDPVFTSVAGGTLGHRTGGLRVKRESDETKNILFPLAVLRFIVKASLGWLSLLIMSRNKKRKAVHDYLVWSVVVYR